MGLPNRLTDLGRPPGSLVSRCPRVRAADARLMELTDEITICLHQRRSERECHASWQGKRRRKHRQCSDVELRLVSIMEWLRLEPSTLSGDQMTQSKLVRDR